MGKRGRIDCLSNVRIRNIELEVRLLNELKDLFHFIPPGKQRRTVEDLVFMYLTENEEINLPDQRKMFEHIYCLINFLNEAEECSCLI